MKKLIPLVIGMALAFGAVTTFAHSNSPKNNAATKAKPTKAKSTKK